MQAGSPDGWNSAINTWNLVRANQEIAACSEAAAKTKRTNAARLTVPAQ